MTILRKLQSNPAKMVSAAGTLVSVGMAILVFAILWPRLPFLANLWPDRSDLLRGMIFGIAIGIEIIAVVIGAAATAIRAKKL